MPGRIDLTGLTVGGLTISQYLGDGKWQTKCICGDEAPRQSCNILQGIALTCGCLKYDPAAMAVLAEQAREQIRRAREMAPRVAVKRPTRCLPGARIGSQTLLQQVGRRRWVTRCDCGYERVVMFNSHVAACLKCAMGARMVLETPPMARSGKLTVVARIGNTNGGWRYAPWLAQCDCGNAHVLSGDTLGRTRSCGCLYKERGERLRKYATRQEAARARQPRYRARVNERARHRRGMLAGTPVAEKMTPEFWEALCDAYRGRCAYCSERRIEVQEHVLTVSRGGKSTYYNIIPACRRCNSTKHSKLLGDALDTLCIDRDLFWQRWEQAFVYAAERTGT